MTIFKTLSAIATGAALVLTAAPLAAQIINSAPGQAVRPDADLRLFHRSQVIVKFADGADPQTVMQAAISGDRESYRPGAALDLARQSTGAVLVDLSAAATAPERDGGRFGVERIGGGAEAAADTPLDQLIDRLNADPRVLYAQKNYLMRPVQAGAINDIIGGGTPADPAAGPNDPYLEFQWHLARYGNAITAETAPGAANFPAAWAAHRPQRDVVVAVVDTGQVYDHDDVAEGLVLPGYDFISDAFTGNDGDGRDADPTDTGDGSEPDDCYAGWPGEDDTWHGSHVSGIAGLAATDNALGIASPLAGGVKFLPVRALGRCGGYTTDLVDAVLWAAGIEVPGVPANPNPAMIINASFGGPAPGCEPAFRDALAQLSARGAILVVAAGNENDDAKFYSPSACPEAFTVAASDINGTLARYSNFGTTVDILAPGGDVEADLNDDGYADGILSIVEDGYSFYNGTSMATPLVAAALAMALSQDPTLSAAQAAKRLTATARPRSETQCAEACGAGLMDMARMMGR